MHDDDTAIPRSVRTYEKRQYRHRQLYWQSLLPASLVIAAGYALGQLLVSVLLVVLGVLIVMLVMLREIIDLLGYLGGLQRDAALGREAVRRELAASKEHISD